MAGMIARLTDGKNLVPLHGYPSKMDKNDRIRTEVQGRLEREKQPHLKEVDT